MSIYEGFGRTLHGGTLKDPKWDYFVLAVSALFEGITVWTAVRDFRKAEGTKPFWDALHATKDPTIAAVLLENVAALIGLGWAFLGTLLSTTLQMPVFDGIASILIGLTLAAVALVLAIEIKSLLIGEAMEKSAITVIRDTAQQRPGVVRVGTPLTMYLGSDSVLLALDIEFDKHLSADEVTSTVDQIEKDIRSRYPMVRRIFIEAESISRNEHVSLDRSR